MKRMQLQLIFLLVLLSGCAPKADPGRQWSMFRGNNAGGFLDGAHLCRSWDVPSGKNIAWKTRIPGLAHSSPVIWDENVYVTTAVSMGGNEDLAAGIYGAIESVNDSSVHEWRLYCIDKKSGKVKWQRTCHRGVPLQKRHPMSSHANATPATNGECVVAFFGSEGLYCYSNKGKLLWSRNFGILKSTFFLVESAEWGFASSPLIHQDAVIVQCDVAENSFLAAFDLKTGKEIWKKQRDEYPGWSTPTIYYNKGKACIAVNGYKHRGGYDFQTGEEIWKMEGGGDIPIPTPVIAQNTLYFNSAHGKVAPVLAIQADARGEIVLDEKGAFIRWGKLRGGSYMGTMLLYGDYLYDLAWNGRLTCYDALSGEVIYGEKVGTGNSYTSSPVASDGIIFIADNSGRVYLVKAGPDFELLEENNLDEPILSTPAISDNYLIFRTKNHLLGVSATE